MSKIKDISGRTFGRLTALSIAGRSNNGHVTWNCKCQCGTLVVVSSSSLRDEGESRGIVSCGCALVKHGHCVNYTISPEHTAWHGMKQRCYNPKSKHYHRYGGRGIVVCRRWLNSFANFFADMGRKPHPLLSLERRKLNRNYTPSNCCWATSHEQSRNKSNNRFITFNGETMIFTDWARRIGMSKPSLWRRLKKMPIELALTLPKRQWLTRKL